MSPQTTYSKFVNIAVVAVMLWNIVGWLGFGLMLNHVHKHGDGSASHCEIALCTCEVEEGEEICSCHHQDLQHNSDHNNEHHGSFCYYTSSHSGSGNSLQILIPITHFNAADFHEHIEWIPPFFEQYKTEQQLQFPAGISADLLRPPRA